MGCPPMGSKQPPSRSNVGALDRTMRMTASSGSGLLLYAVVAILIFVGLLIIWPTLGPMAAGVWFALLLVVGMTVRIVRGRR